MRQMLPLSLSLRTSPLRSVSVHCKLQASRPPVMSFCSSSSMCSVMMAKCRQSFKIVSLTSQVVVALALLVGVAESPFSSSYLFRCARAILQLGITMNLTTTKLRAMESRYSISSFITISPKNHITTQRFISQYIRGMCRRPRPRW